MLLRLVLALFVLFLLLTVLRGLRIFLHAFLRRSARPGAPRPGGTREAEMVRDPVCGTWIDRGIAVAGRKGGQTVAVCSEECRKALERAG
jgi:YHS domain-containing protein